MPKREPRHTKRRGSGCGASTNGEAAGDSSPPLALPPARYHDPNFRFNAPPPASSGFGEVSLANRDRGVAGHAAIGGFQYQRNTVARGSILRDRDVHLEHAWKLRSLAREPDRGRDPPDRNRRRRVRIANAAWAGAGAATVRNGRRHSTETRDIKKSSSPARDGSGRIRDTGIFHATDTESVRVACTPYSRG